MVARLFVTILVFSLGAGSVLAGEDQAAKPEAEPAAPPPKAEAVEATRKQEAIPEGKPEAYPHPFPGPAGLAVTPPGADVTCRIESYLQLWVVVLEQVENGKRQPYTGDTAAPEASGFSFRRARLSADFALADAPVDARIGLRWEGSPGLLDAWGRWNPLDGALVVQAGQMKVPSAYEVGVSSAGLDFPTRSRFAQRVVDWSLSRGPSMSSAFPGARTYLRDAGLAVRGELFGGRYFLMIGNGLGANFFIGGHEYKQFLFTNGFGAYFYGIRLSWDPLLAFEKRLEGFPVRSVRIGGHACWNRHPEVILNDERTVTDLFRRSWSWDVRLDVLGRVRLTWMMGGGVVDDDFDHDGKTDYLYRGWEAKAVVVVWPGWLEAGFRWDAYWDEKFKSGDDGYLDAYTLGLTFTFARTLRVQMSYTWKILTSAAEPDLDDDLFLIALQLGL